MFWQAGTSMLRKASAPMKFNIIGLVLMNVNRPRKQWLTSRQLRSRRDNNFSVIIIIYCRFEIHSECVGSWMKLAEKEACSWSKHNIVAWVTFTELPKTLCSRRGCFSKWMLRFMCVWLMTEFEDAASTYAHREIFSMCVWGGGGCLASTHTGRGLYKSRYRKLHKTDKIICLFKAVFDLN